MQRMWGLLTDRPVVVPSSAGRVTSDAGLLPLGEFDRGWQFTERMAGCLEDRRKDPEHTVVEMAQQLLFGIIADDEDCLDHDDLRDDPLFRLLAGKASGEGPLASQRPGRGLKTRSRRGCCSGSSSGRSRRESSV